MKKFVVYLTFLLFLSCSDDPIVDSDPPTIVSIFPEENSVDIDRNIAMSVTFDEQIDSTSLINSITLTSNSVTVTGVSTYDSDSYRVTFKPDISLDYFTDYTLSLSGEIKDLKGNSIEPKSWSFRTVPEIGNAKFQITFQATWDGQTHPVEAPSNPHFSGLIGMTHNADTVLFHTGTAASDGIKRMAEFGGKVVLSDEIETIISEGNALKLISGGGVPISPGNVSVEVETSPEYSLLSIVSMIAPSPDWFIGISGYNLYREGKWIKSVTLDVNSYDAGTDSGLTFLSPNEVTDPIEPISKITTPPLAVNGVVQPLGQFIIMRIID